jgi:Flp pilus assembly protein TadG
MPVVVVLVLGVLQVALVARDQLAVEAIARDAARAAAVSATPDVAARAAADRMTAGRVDVTVEVRVFDGVVTVRVRAPPARVPVVGRIAPDALTASATMQLEPP